MRTFFTYAVAVMVALTASQAFSVSQETPAEEEHSESMGIIKNESKPLMDTIVEPDAREIMIETQKRVSVTLGFGLPEAVNLGIRIKLIPRMHIGAYLGGMYEPPRFTLSDGGSKSNTWLAYGAMSYFYFPGSSDNPKPHPWYLRAGPAFLKDNNYYFTQKMTFADLRLGKTINFYNKHALDLDAGTVILLNDKTEAKHEGSVNELTDLYTRKIGLCLGFKAIFRI